MNRRYAPMLVSLLLSSMPFAAFGQEAPSPRAIVTLNEGIFHYLQGQANENEESLTTAIDRFTWVIERDPADTTALLFRALAHGQAALVKRGKRQSAQNDVRFNEKMLEIRQDRAGREGLETEQQEAQAVLDSDSASAAEKNVARKMLRHHGVLLRRLDGAAATSDEKLEEARKQAVERSCEIARLEREHHLEMVTDLRRMAIALEHPATVVRLLEVVASAKVARIEEEEARYVVRGDIPESEAQYPVGAMREDAAALLNGAAQILETLPVEDVDQRTLLRTRFFLAVIRYRQAVPLRAEKEVQKIDARSKKLLRQAERLMTELADGTSGPLAWRSYAALYLGFILPCRAGGEADPRARDALFDEADRRLTQAAELDAAARLDAKVSEPESIVPDLVWRHRKRIAKERERVPAAPPPRNDISLSLYSGTRWDSNVVLLGERTDLPRDISRERDFGFTSGLAIEYTRDFKEGLTLGVQGRATGLWNVDIDEFDQETYGASVALQYEVFPKGERFGPVYLWMQYDFDYTLLGRVMFLRSHAITPSVRAYWGEKLRTWTDLSFTYQIRDYFEPLFDRRFNRDGTYLAVGVSQRFKMLEMNAMYERWGIESWGLPGDKELAQDDPEYPDRYLTPYVGVGWAWDATSGDEFDRQAANLSLGVELPLPWGVELEASAIFERENYPQNSLTDYHRRQRRDLVQDYGIALSRTFVLRAGDPNNRYTPAVDRLLMTVRAFATWTLDDSNVVDRFGQAVFEYDRAVLGLSFAFTFN